MEAQARFWPLGRDQRLAEGRASKLLPVVLIMICSFRLTVVATSNLRGMRLHPGE